MSRDFSQRPKKALKVYCEVATFRSCASRLQGRGSELLAQLELAEQRVARARNDHTLSPIALSADEFIATNDLSTSIDRWLRSRALDRFLGDSDLAPFRQARRVDGRGWRDVNGLRAAVQRRLGIIGSLLDRLPSKPDQDPYSLEGIRLDELRRSSLVQARLIDSWHRKTKGKLTPARARDAIGAAKEACEATMIGVLNMLNPSRDARSLDFVALNKALREELKRRSEFVAPSHEQVDSLDRFQSGIGNIIHSIADIRNDHGSGHGRPQIAKNLRPRHARLVIDAAESYIRFLVLTLEDLGCVD